jgi:hypothetical protein
VGSPKFHCHPVIVPELAAKVEAVLLKSTALLSQARFVMVNLAAAVSYTLIVWVAESRQPAAVEECKYLIVYVPPGLTEEGVKIPAGVTPVPLNVPVPGTPPKLINGVNEIGEAS